MGKITILISCILFLSACDTTPVIKTEVQHTVVPVLYCPAPPSYNRPELLIHSITEDTTSGDVVKVYKATIQSLLDYSRELELMLEHYKQINEVSEKTKQTVTDYIENENL